MSELEASLAAAKKAAPAYPDLSGRVSELESKLADAEARRRAPTYPNLAGRVSELEGLLADAKRQLSDTEARLSRAVETAMKGRTCLVIAHRLSTIRAANRIVVFHRGHVAEQGTHDELIERGGVYAKLHALQFAKEKIAAA